MGTYYKYTFSTDDFYRKQGEKVSRLKRKPKNWKYLMEHAGSWQKKGS